MRNQESWKETKFVIKKNKLVASKDQKKVGVGSRLMVSYIAFNYDQSIKHYVKGKLLDLGCGEVPLFKAYKNFITDSVCIDWENTIHKNPYLDLEHNINEPLPFQDEEFDTIVLSDVLEHIYRPEQLWLEMNRVLKKNGKVLLNVPFYYWLHEIPHDYYRYTEYALKKFAESSNFKIVLLKSSGGAIEIIADILSKNIVKIPIMGKVIARFIQWVTFVFCRTGIGRKISNKTSSRFPLLYFMVVEKK